MPTKRNRPKPPSRRNSEAWSLPSSCPGCGEEGPLVEKQVASIHEIRGEEVTVDVSKYVCGSCECAFMSPAQATAGVKIAVAAYQRGHRLLTAAERSKALDRMFKKVKDAGLDDGSFVGTTR